MASAAEPSIETIKEVTRLWFGVTQIDLVSQRRDAPTAVARHVAMWLCRTHTTASLPAIGMAFGNRDHTTVIHAVRRIERMMRESPEFAGSVKAIEARLYQPAREGERTHAA